MGRKSKYDPETFPLLAEGFAREGLTDTQICKKLGISKDSFYTYQNKYPEFSDSIKKGKAPVDTEVENSLLKRAMGYEYEEVTTEISVSDIGKETKHKKIIKKEIIPSTTAQIFWLKNRKPKKWRDKQEIDHTSKGEKISGININVIRDPKQLEEKK